MSGDSGEVRSRCRYSWVSLSESGQKYLRVVLGALLDRLRLSGRRSPRSAGVSNVSLANLARVLAGAVAVFEGRGGLGLLVPGKSVLFGKCPFASHLNSNANYLNIITEPDPSLPRKSSSCRLHQSTVALQSVLLRGNNGSGDCSRAGEGGG